MFTRILLLLSLAWVMRLTHPLFSLFNEAVSGRDIILIVGGLFLLAKSTHEIHGSLEGSKRGHHRAFGASNHGQAWPPIFQNYPQGVNHGFFKRRI